MSCSRLLRPRLDAAIRLAVTMMVRFTAVALESGEPWCDESHCDGVTRRQLGPCICVSSYTSATLPQSMILSRERLSTLNISGSDKRA
jgi:hypothetical protein